MRGRGVQRFCVSIVKFSLEQLSRVFSCFLSLLDPNEDMTRKNNRKSKTEEVAIDARRRQNSSSGQITFGVGAACCLYGTYSIVQKLEIYTYFDFDAKYAQEASFFDAVGLFLTQSKYRHRWYMKTDIHMRGNIAAK